MPDIIATNSVLNRQATFSQPSPLDNVSTTNTSGQQFLPPAPIFNPSASYITNFSNPQQNFLDALSYYAASVPLKSFWLVQFQIPFLIQEQNLKGLSETFENNDFARADLGNNRFMKNIGCIFCRSFNFAGEVNSSAVPEMDIRGFRSVPYAGGRSSAIFQNLNLSFYESSISFIDFIIRPWIILMSYYSTIARNGDDPSNEVINGLKQDITCHLMTRTGVAKGSNRQSAQEQNANSDSAIPNYNFPWTYRKQITFKNCFPKDMGNLEFSQMDSNSLETVAVNFCYSNYEIKHNPINPGNLNR